MLSIVAVLALGAVAASAAEAGVIALTSDNFDDFVGGDKPVFVKFYAPWCGHCKALAPEYEVVGSTFQSTDNIVIGKVDADAHKELAGRFDVSGYPTLKYFPAESTTPKDYQGGRSADDIVSYINQNAGTSRRVRKAPTAVTELNAANFDAIALDEEKEVIVEFFAPWCGHCKQLAPTYEKVAQTFQSEKGVVVASVDATVERDLASRFDITGFPTIKVFGKGTTEPEDWARGRDAADFVDYLNEKASLKRKLGGALESDAGRLSAMDELASAYAAAADKKAAIAAAEKAAGAFDGEEARYAAYYVKFMKKIADKGEGFVAKETARLEKLAGSDSVKPERKDSFMLRRNILAAFA